MYGLRRPTRPIASCTVADPNARSRSTASRSARTMLRYTTPSSYMTLSPDSAALCLQYGVEPREHPARVALVHELALLLAQVGRRFDVAPGVVEVMAGLWIHAADRADHLGREQNVLDGDHLRQQVDAGLVIDAR